MKKYENKTGLPINVLIDELKSDDIRKRVNSVRNLQVISSNIGPDKTKSDLVPFLNELLEDEDEVLLELSSNLFNFIELLGPAQNSLCLLALLENLSKVEESTVREKVQFN